MCTPRENVYYIGPLKGSIWNAGSQKCCKITWKIRGWMEEMQQIACKYEAGHQKCIEMLQIACKLEGLGHHLGTHTMGEGPATRDTAAYIWFIYVTVWSRFLKWHNSCFRPATSRAAAGDPSGSVRTFLQSSWCEVHRCPVLPLNLTRPPDSLHDVARLWQVQCPSSAGERILGQLMQYLNYDAILAILVVCKRMFRYFQRIKVWFNLCLP